MKYPLLSAMVIAALSATALAETPIKNISTGYDDANNALLGDLAVDTDWTISAGGTAGHVGEPLSTIIGNVPGPYIPAGDSAASAWIGLYTNGGISVEPGTYRFTTLVNIDPLMATSTIGFSTLRFAADDKVLDISINGTSIYAATCACPDYDDWTTLDCVGAGLFVNGANQITFLVENGSSDPLNPMGLRVEGTVALDACNSGAPVPEPTTAGLLALSAMGLMARFRRKAI